MPPHGPWKYTKEYVEEYCEKIIEWAAQPPHRDENDMWCDLNIADFCLQNNIFPQCISEWANKYRCFSEALNCAKVLLGMKRERLGLNKNIDSTYMKSQALYDPDYKDLISWLKTTEHNSLTKSMGAIKEFIENCKKDDNPTE